MNTYDKLVSFDGSLDVSAEEWRAFLDELMLHFKSGKSPASGANLWGVMAVFECQAHLDQSEAMQCSFRLAMHLAASDFPLVQKAIRQTRQKRATDKKRENLSERKNRILADYDELLATEPKHKIVKMLASKYDLSTSTIRSIIRRHRMNQ